MLGRTLGLSTGGAHHTIDTRCPGGLNVVPTYPGLRVSSHQRRRHKPAAIPDFLPFNLTWWLLKLWVSNYIWILSISSGGAPYLGACESFTATAVRAFSILSYTLGWLVPV